jgi:GNAT superfamily N-acetyltransferase
MALHQRSSDAVLTLASDTLNHPADGFGFVARLLVAPEARRKGIGRLLLQTATAESVRLGLWPILDVVTVHRAAIKLYEQVGWTRAGQVTARFSDGHELEEVVLIGPSPAV